MLTLRKEIGTLQDTVRQVAHQLGLRLESVRGWVEQTEPMPARRPGATLTGRGTLKELEQETARSSARPWPEIVGGSSRGGARPTHMVDGRLHRRAQGRPRGRADLHHAAVRPRRPTTPPSHDRHRPVRCVTRCRCGCSSRCGSRTTGYTAPARCGKPPHAPATPSAVTRSPACCAR